jgi:cobalamin synthase
MTYAILFLLCVVFLELFLFLELRKDAVAILARSREAVRVLCSAETDDDRKEAFMRRASAQTLKATAVFTLKFVLIFLLLYLIYRGAIAAIPGLEGPLVDSFVSPPVIVILTIATLCYAWARNALVKQL